MEFIVTIKDMIKGKEMYILSKQLADNHFCVPVHNSICGITIGYHFHCTYKELIRNMKIFICLMSINPPCPT